MRQEIPLHDLLGFEFEAPAEGSTVAEVHMPVRPQAYGFTANLHGGAIATLVDLACALAAARATDFDPTTESLVTADMHVRYLGRPGTDRVTARAEIVRLGSQLIVVDCRITDGDGHLIAVADFSMMRVPLRRPLDPDVVGDPGDPEL
ncbi:MAG: PaaI family thioesterase [Microthrixaceae bacterium]